MRGNAGDDGGYLRIGVDDISIKATTTEQMGFVGRGEGLVAYATVLLEKARRGGRAKHNLAQRRLRTRRGKERRPDEVL
jgi:hypothetical protein